MKPKQYLITYFFVNSTILSSLLVTSTIFGRKAFFTKDAKYEFIGALISIAIVFAGLLLIMLLISLFKKGTRTK